MAFRDSEGGGYSIHGWANDMHHIEVFRGVTNDTASIITASDYHTMREYGNFDGTSKMIIMGGSTSQEIKATIGPYTYIKQRLGIGTQSPSYALHVNGTLYYSGSSIKYKENVEDYKHDGSKLDQLRPVKYDYKEGHKEKGKNTLVDYQIGFIAEEVAEVYPELAITTDKHGKVEVTNVDYEKICVMLVAEVQALRKRVEELESK